MRAFVSQLGSLVDAMVSRQIQGVLGKVFGQQTSGAPGALPAGLSGAVTTRVRPRQLCPIPGCKNPAAPAFGMVCKEHKDVPKRIVKRFRAERRGDFSHLEGGQESARQQKTAPPKKRAAAEKPVVSKPRPKTVNRKAKASPLTRAKKAGPKARAPKSADRQATSTRAPAKPPRARRRNTTATKSPGSRTQKSVVTPAPATHEPAAEPAIVANAPDGGAES